MNPTIELLDRRHSVRAYSDQPIAPHEREAVLGAAFRAPTAGNMMLYSIIDVQDQGIKDRLAVLCDDQPFIAKAPLVLVFVADYQKWIDLFDHVGAKETALPQGHEHRSRPAEGDLMLAMADALVAAQNAVVAAESLGIGSCYIGDIIERGEEVSELLNLPPHAVPAAMLCFGHAAAHREPAPRYTDHVVHIDRYARQSVQQLAQTTGELGPLHRPQGLAPGVGSYPEDVYRRKWTAEFSLEMNRSGRWWIERWCGRG